MYAFSEAASRRRRYLSKLADKLSAQFLSAGLQAAIWSEAWVYQMLSSCSSEAARRSRQITHLADPPVSLLSTKHLPSLPKASSSTPSHPLRSSDRHTKKTPLPKGKYGYESGIGLGHIIILDEERVVYFSQIFNILFALSCHMIAIQELV
ncbi:unnamed protein product [Protopolystoma xenopodis]|uniref:Uncharacterized protein n=1 Tax=Protopolystoma xenopodis TaxID=117903 RepID=A0A3S5BAN7_9PLAT|nr:unnamed protein product [Protopolystoma xenopodis]